MNLRSEKKVVKDYENRKICRCGAKADHHSGLCWPCHDKHPASTTRVQRRELYAQLEEMELAIREGETKEQWNERCREWCAEHSPFLGKLARSFAVRKKEIEQDAVMGGHV